VSPRRDTTVGSAPRRSLLQYSLAGAIAGGGSALVLIALLVFGVLGGGPSQHPAAKAHASSSRIATAKVGAKAPSKTLSRAGTHASRAGANSAPTSAATAGQPAGGATGSTATRRELAATEVPDPEAARSFPAPASTRHKAAATPEVAAEAAVAPGAPSDAEVRRELHQMQAVERAARKQTFTAVPGGQSIGGNGTVAPPPGIPAVIARVIAGANAIADFPYVFGGGHASFVDNAYDCSGSVSYALAAGGLLSAPETSGSLESWGAPGPGKWITVYANAGHTYMYVDGMLYDTAGRSGVYASRWQVGATDNSGYVARHWPGL
jgi:cell wall-associated NlpC family hydrolase